MADVDPGSPADTAGVQTQDIVTTVDEATVEILDDFKARSRVVCLLALT